MAETTPTTTAKDQIAKANEARQKSQDKAVKAMEQSKPTPTQEENDLARMGVDVPNKEDDGSGPDPTTPEARAGSDEERAAAAKEAKSAGVQPQQRQVPPQRNPQS